MKYIFNRINENNESAFESAIPQGFSSTRNIAKSGENLNWGGFKPFQLCVGLTGNHSQSASYHIATRQTVVGNNYKECVTLDLIIKQDN